MLLNADPAIERRRVQNRMAQRRFRQKRSQQKSLDQQQERDVNQEHVEPPLGADGTQPPSDHTPGPSPTASVLCADNHQQVAEEVDRNPFAGVLFHDMTFLNFVSQPEEDASLTASVAHPPLQDPSTEESVISTSVEHDIEIAGWGSNVGRSESDVQSISGEWGLQSSMIAAPGASTPLTSHAKNCNPPDIAANGIVNNTRWKSPLHMATQKGQDRIVRILLEHNADCNERDSDGKTPLMHSIEGGLEEILRLLLAHGAHVKETDHEGRSALHLAVLHRREALLRVLLNHCSGGGDLTPLIEHYDKSGKTPLHLAVDIGFESGVLILLQLGANPSSRAVCQPESEMLQL